MKKIDQRIRWRAYFESIDARVILGEITGAQARCFADIWCRALGYFPILKYPSVDHDEELLTLSWSFVDVEGITLTIVINAYGQIDWFYVNRHNGIVLGTSFGFDPEFPKEHFSLFESFAV